MKEDQQTEFKENWRDEFLKWVCGFANTHGGSLYIGINDKGIPIGVPHSKKLLEDIPNKISSILGVMANVDLVNMEGKEVISISVPKSNVPIAYHGKYYYRSGSTLQELSGIALQDFILKRLGMTWESKAVENASLYDIDSEAVVYYIQKGIQAKRLPEAALTDTVETVLRNSQLIDSQGRLTMAALLLFGKEPQRFCLSSRIKIGMFGTGYADLNGEDIIGGNLIQMADRVMDVLDKKYLTRPIHYEGWQRIEPLEIPDEALREILYNAIIHKDYRGSETTIRVFKDRLEIWNPGTLPEDFDLNNLWTHHGSVKRNHLIADVFYHAGFIENWGRGFQKIHDSFKKNGLKLPTFATHTGGFEVSILREKYAGLMGKNEEKSDSFDQRNFPLKPSAQRGKQRIRISQLSEEQKIICFLISRNPSISIKKISEFLTKEMTKEMTKEIKHSPKSIQRELETLKEMGIIARQGSTKKGEWIILQPVSIKKTNSQTKNFPLHITLELHKELSERQKDILKLLASDLTLKLTLNTAAIAKSLEKTRQTISKDLEILTTKGFIRRVGTKKNGHWELITSPRGTNP